MQNDKRRALISVFTKNEALMDFVRGLTELDFEIISSGGTAKYLRENGIEVTDIQEISGMGPILGHRVVTLVPEVHAGLLATPDMFEELQKLNYPKYDLVYVTFYPLAEELERDGSTFQSCIEKTDIGGPTMIRSANKGGEVIVMTEPSQEKGVLKWLTDGEPDRREVLNVLRARAEMAVAEYIELSAKVHSTYSYDRALLEKYSLI